MYAPKSVDCGMDLKEKVAVHATQFVRSGTTIGLGSGSTMSFFIRVLGQRLRLGELREVLAVPTSEQTARQAHSAGIPLTTLDDHPHLDVAIDGADEVDANLNLIKGLGKALLREKVVAAHSHSFIIIVDVSKLVPRLGTRGPLLVELVPFAAGAQIRWFHTMGCRAEIWQDDDGVPILTDNGNQLARLWFEDGILEPESLARDLESRPGIVEHGLFLNMATMVIVADKGEVRELERSR